VRSASIPLLQANNKTYSDKDGHVKLSDFGLATGFHKHHDSSYYQRLLESESNPSANGAAQSTRNSIMVNSINLTMTNKDQIATWKANRRKLVCHRLDICSRYSLNMTGLLDCWNTRLHCSRNFPTEGLWEGMRLVVFGSDYVRVLSWLSTVLLGIHA